MINGNIASHTFRCYSERVVVEGWLLCWGDGVVKGDRSDLAWSHVLKYHHEQVYIDLWFHAWKKFYLCDFFG